MKTWCAWENAEHTNRGKTGTINSLRIFRAHSTLLHASSNQSYEPRRLISNSEPSFAPNSSFKEYVGGDDFHL